MKKIKTLFVALSSAALLASCGANVSFKEFTYKRVLSDNEKAAFIEKVKSVTFAKLNKYEYEDYLEITKLIKNSKASFKYVTNFYKNDEMEWQCTNKQSGKDAEKVYDYEYHTNFYRALFDAENLKYAEAFEYEQDNSYSYGQETLPESELGLHAMNDLESAILNLTDSQMKAYEDKKGNVFFAFSKVQETNQLVNYGNSKKNYHRILKEQRVAELNNDFTLKSISYVYSVEQNRDPDTNEFYNKTKQTQVNTESYKFYYGEKADASAKVVELRQKAKEGYRLSTSNPTVKGKAFKEDGTELASSYNFSVEQNKQFEFGKRHIVARFYNLVPKLGEDVSTVKLQVSGQSLSNAVADPVAFDLEVPIASLGAGNSGLSLVDGAIKLGKNNVSIKIEFDLEATAQGAVASNVAAYAILSTLS